MTMRAFQPNRRRSQPPRSSPPSNTRPVPNVPLSASLSAPLSAPPPLSILRSLPNPQPQPTLRPPPTPQLTPSTSNPQNPPSSSKIIEPRLPHDIPGLHTFDKLINYLLSNRLHLVSSFMDECWHVYNSKYKKSKRNTTKPTPQINHSDPSQPPHPPIQPPTSDTPEPVPDSNPVQSLESPSPEHPPPTHIPLFDRKAQLDHLVYQRWKTFHTHHQHPPQHPPSPSQEPQQEQQSDQHILVWRSPESPHNPVFLDSRNCCLALQGNDSNLSPIHLKALTFLWYNLIENPCTGAIFNHGIGYPRTHIIFLFAHLVLTSPGRENNKILVICPPAARAQWEMTQDHFFEKVTINILTKSQWQENINQWRRRGGVLVADYDAYANILRSDACPEKLSAQAALCCPGPDICILDEAAKTNTIPSFPQYRRFLNRTRTKARLALTSLPLAGFITRAWSIVDWACPSLFGTNVEYYSDFVHPIARGHQSKSTSEQTLEAFRKACLLFNKMSMVTFTIDASTRRESLSSKKLRIHESVVWVNISREEYAIYLEVERFLNKAIQQHGLSPFLAVDLLVCAASSVHALQSTVKTWANADPQCLQAVGDPAHDLFLGLARMLDTRVNEDLTCTKLQLSLYLGRQCLLSNERLVIFTSSQDLLDEVHRFLASKLDKGKVYKYDALQHTSSQKNLSLDDFNTVQGGAILIAPYGPTIHCMEESGWGFINATRVLFIDSSWHSGASVQAVNRVHNFAQMNSDLHVHHFLARETVEYELSSQLERRYKYMQSCDSSSLPETIPGIAEKAFLTAPEVAPSFIRESPPQDISRSELPSVNKRDTDEEDSSNVAAEHDSIIVPLKNTQDTSNREYYVHEVILRSDRYRIMSENLDMWMRSEWSRKTRFLVEAVDGAKWKDLIKLHRDSLHLFGEYAIDAIDKRQSGKWLTQDGIFMEEDMCISHLLTSWEPYRRLFERAEVSSLPPPPQNRRDKRPRPYDQHDRHPKILRRDHVL